jgi:hypothetical protein
MNHREHSAPAASDIAAARLLLANMGIDPADLLRDPAGPSEIPTFADYIPRVSQAVSAGTRCVYGTYWNRVVEAWGPRLITSVTPWRSASWPKTSRRTSSRAGTPAAVTAPQST